jgi:hypothetical protein
MSQITELASAAITAVDTITIEPERSLGVGDNDVLRQGRSRSILAVDRRHDTRSTHRKGHLRCREAANGSRGS